MVRIENRKSAKSDEVVDLTCVGLVIVIGSQQWRKTLAVIFSVLSARMCPLNWMPVLLRFLIQYPAKFEVLIGSVLRLHLIPAPCYRFRSNSIISYISGLFLWFWDVFRWALAQCKLDGGHMWHVVGER